MINKDNKKQVDNSLMQSIEEIVKKKNYKTQMGGETSMEGL